MFNPANTQRITTQVTDYISGIPIQEEQDFAFAVEGLRSLLQNVAPTHPLPKHIAEQFELIEEYLDPSMGYITQTETQNDREFIDPIIQQRINYFTGLSPEEKAEYVQEQRQRRELVQTQKAAVSTLQAPAEGSEAHVDSLEAMLWHMSAWADAQESAADAAVVQVQENVNTVNDDDNDVDVDTNVSTSNDDANSDERRVALLEHARRLAQQVAASGDYAAVNEFIDCLPPQHTRAVRAALRTMLSGIASNALVQAVENGNYTAIAGLLDRIGPEYLNAIFDNNINHNFIHQVFNQHQVTLASWINNNYSVDQAESIFNKIIEHRNQDSLSLIPKNSGFYITEALNHFSIHQAPKKQTPFNHFLNEPPSLFSYISTPDNKVRPDNFSTVLSLLKSMCAWLSPAQQSQLHAMLWNSLDENSPAYQVQEFQRISRTFPRSNEREPVTVELAYSICRNLVIDYDFSKRRQQELFRQAFDTTDLSTRNDSQNDQLQIRV